MFNMESTQLEGVVLVHPRRLVDERGFFSEVFNKEAMSEVGISDHFVQDNHSLSRHAGTIRGLHFQIPPRPTAKLVRVVTGAVFDVVVDLRQGSPTFGHHVSAELSAENWVQIYVPIGFAHGFCTIAPDTEVVYKVTDYWSPEVDRGVAWDDPELGIEWPVSTKSAILSDKDRGQPSLSELPTHFEWEHE